VFAHSLVPLADVSGGKFVVLAFGKELHFVTAPVGSHPYHANIVFSFIEEAGRGQAALTAPTQCVISTPGWKVLGGGRYEVQAETKVFRLSDKSTAYGKYPAAALRKSEEALMAALGLDGFSLRLE